MTSLAIDVHIILIVSLFFVIARNLYLLLTEQNFITLAKKIRFITPIFHLLIAGILFSGIVIQFYYRDFDNIPIYVMIFATIFVMVAEIKRYKKQRVITSTEYQLQEEFKTFAKKIYFIDLGIIIVIYVLAEALK